MSGVDHYAVVGNPIAHSLSPQIHTCFAQQTRHKILYEKIEAPLDGFEDRALALRDAGYRGLNVTVPFKLDAAKLANDLTPRARYAGGAVRGVLGSILDESPKWVAVANRSHHRAAELAEEFGVEAIHFDEIPAEHFDLIVNGTTTGLNHEAPAIDPETFNDCVLAYDLVYAAEPTPFMQLAASSGAKQVADGLGMLIEQAAESFHVWRGVRPDTDPVYHELRALLSRESAESATTR
jgi:shikimate dehydrogenase